MQERMTALESNCKIELVNVTKRFGKVIANDSVNLTIEGGKVLCLLGENGSGKTTLMNMIGCMDTPSKGSVKLEGRKLEDLNATQLADVRKNLIGLVFQKFYLVPHLTAVENVMVAQYYHSVVDEKQALEALKKVGLKDRAHHLPSQLSGGQQQRVACARAIMERPSVIFADEPTGNLDSRSSHEVFEFLRMCVREYGQTIVMVTHDPRAASFADRVLVLSDGSIVQDLDHPSYDDILAVFAQDDDPQNGPVEVESATARSAEQ